MGSDFGLVLLIFGPAVVALGSVGLAVYLAHQGSDGEARGPGVVRWIAIVLLSLLAFGIGSCYAVMFLGGSLGG